MANESVQPPTHTGQTLGEFLRQEREKRGITIEQVASATKIAVRILHFLEADQYVELPAKPFIRGFVISYARFIGLDSKEVMTRFGDFIDTKATDRPTRDQGHSGYAFEKRETEQSRTFLWIIMGGFFVIGGILFVFLKPSLHRHHGAHERLRGVQSPLPSASPSPGEPGALVSPSPIPSVVPGPEAPEKFHAPARPLVLLEPVSAPSPEETIPAPAPEVSATPAAPPTTSPNDPLNSGADLKKSEIRQRVVFRAVEDVWVRYQSDNRKPMRFILRKDKILVLRAHDLIKFQASDPKAIRFSTPSHPGKLMAEEKTAVMRQGDLTLYFPSEVADSIKEPFPGAPRLAHTPVPAAPTPKASPSFTP